MFEEVGRQVKIQLSGKDNSNSDYGSGLLREGEFTGCQLVPRGSNYVYLVSLEWSGQIGLAVYKPKRGEAPLWDFPDGTLYQRELAAYLVSEALGWQLIPTTIIRDGPHGIGMLQKFVANKQTIDYSRLFEKNLLQFKKIALFDWLTNNADRKVGHCLEDMDGKVWIIDHGLTFHEVPKLRTVIWDFSGQTVPEPLLDDLAMLSGDLNAGRELSKTLSTLISKREIVALKERLAMILHEPVYPDSFGFRRRMPWPPF